MNPTRSKPTCRPAEIERKVWCRRYSDCLDHTIRQGWPGFVCNDCGDYQEHVPTDAIERREDAIRCASVWVGSIKVDG